MTGLAAAKFEMRLAFAATNRNAHAIITGVTEPPPTIEDLARAWVNEACRHWYRDAA